jgi:hypothetical protein
MATAVSYRVLAKHNNNISNDTAKLFQRETTNEDCANNLTKQQTVLHRHAQYWQKNNT